MTNGAAWHSTIGGRFAGGPNAFHLIRLLLALEVLAWHSHVLRGGTLPPAAAHVAAGVGVDGFFALSGFLIVASWQRRPHLGRFALARARRLLPGLWACLAVTGLVIVPAACLAAGQPLPSLSDALGFVWRNAAVQVRQWGVGDTSAPLHDPGWNGSLWSLIWEVRCYAVVVLLGVVGALRPRVVAGIVVALWLYALTLELVGVGSDAGGVPLLWMPQRCGLMFGLGALLWLHRDRIPVDGRLVALAAATVPVGALTFENYRLLAAPGVAYVCVAGGLLLARWPAAVLRHDLSYGVYVYAFPLQQAMLLAGLAVGWLPFLTLSAAAVVPLAIGSWFLVERPALRWRWAGASPRTSSRSAPAPAAAGPSTS